MTQRTVAPLRMLIQFRVALVTPALLLLPASSSLPPGVTRYVSNTDPTLLAIH